MPGRIRYDNLKTAVVKVLQGRGRASVTGPAQPVTTTLPERRWWIRTTNPPPASDSRV